MASCKECIHYDICIFHLKGNECDKCLHFKPTADVVEVKHGKWTQISYTTLHKCSVCKNMIDMPYQNKLFDYCPKCGAIMNGGKEE